MSTTTPEVIVHEPTVSIKVETLFSEVNRKMEHISQDVSRLVEIGHKKADKIELEKVEEKFERRITDLEKTSATIVAVKENERKLEEMGRSYKMHWISTLAAVLIGIGSIIVALIRH